MPLIQDIELFQDYNNFIMLKKDIKKALIETKTKKESLLIEQKIIESRISIILEKIDSTDSFQNLSEENQLKIAFKLMNEISYFEETGLLNEQLGDFLSKIFGSSFGGITQTIVEPLVNSLLSSLGLKGYFKNFLVSFITSRPSQLISAFKDCKVMSTLLAEALSEAVFMTMQQEKGYGGFGYDMIRNVLGGAIKDTKFIKGIEEGISKIVCGLFEKYTDNAKDLVGKLSPNAVAPVAA